MSLLAYPFPAVPEPARATEIVPGIRWLRMPLPFQLDHINLWLLADGDGWTLVDTGLASEATRDLWQRAFAEVLEGRPVKRIIATHFHPDHMGLAGWLTERLGTVLWATLGEWLLGRMLSVDQTAALIAANVAFYRQGGFPPELLRMVEARGNIYAKRISPVPVSFHRIAAGERIVIGGREWRVIVGAGHAPEHACLYCAEAGVLISGDQILPKITPIVGVWASEPDADPLGQYIGSLDQFRDLPEEVLVLPSHGLPFRGLHARLDELAHHHDSRLARTVDACRQPVTGLELLRALFTRPLDDQQTMFALSESLAHANYLIARGEIRRESRPDGVWLYRQAG